MHQPIDEPRPPLMQWERDYLAMCLEHTRWYLKWIESMRRHVESQPFGAKVGTTIRIRKPQRYASL